MKRKYRLVSIALLSLGLSFSSCSDYLNVDQYFKDRLSLERTFKSKCILQTGSIQ